MPANYSEIVGELDRVLARVCEPPVGVLSGPCLRTVFPSLVTLARAKAPVGAEGDRLRNLSVRANYASHDLLNLFTLASRMEWMLGLADSGTLSEGHFGEYATADIEGFHTQLRSLFDYLAQAMAPYASRKIPESFRRLQDRILCDNQYGAGIGQALADLVIACNWFGYMRDTRDELVHRGGRSIIFPARGEILFQTYGEEGIRHTFPPVMYNENVADFRLYGGMYLGRLSDYMEKWALTMATIAGVDVAPMQAGFCGPGVPVAIKWIQLARQRFAQCASA